MLTRYKRPDPLKEWGQNLARTKCLTKASVAVARKMAVIMHAMWRDGTSYRGARERSAADLARKLHHHEAKAVGPVA